MSHQDSSGQSHGSVKEYLTGLALSLVLTFIPFGLVAMSSMTPGSIMAIIIACAIAQLLVQGIFFLHMNGDSSQSWNTTSAIYVISTILFFVIGTIWIFNHLNHNMLMGH
ncbi:MAG: cytochrome o ubiquinol oxidase subunit IV [Gammaproteobacteria bacterium]|nr:MAG: cytochrome o ubiquinol oxidase subunit IV [Gammaproteobacteria bacterium]